jgi:hypothetical protein
MSLRGDILLAKSGFIKATAAQVRAARSPRSSEGVRR